MFPWLLFLPSSRGLRQNQPRVGSMQTFIPAIHVARRLGSEVANFPILVCGFHGVAPGNQYPQVASKWAEKTPSSRKMPRATWNFWPPKRSEAQVDGFLLAFLPNTCHTSSCSRCFLGQALKPWPMLWVLETNRAKERRKAKSKSKNKKQKLKGLPLATYIQYSQLFEAFRPHA